MAERKLEVGGRVQSETMDIKNLDICEKHNKPFEYFCEDDKALACSKCAFISHRRCKHVTELETVDTPHLEENLTDKLHSAITTTKQAMENIKEAKVHLEKDVQKLVDKLKEIKIEIIQAVDTLTEKVTQQAVSYRDKTLSDWDESLQNCEANIDSLKSALNTIDSIVTGGTKVQKFILNHQMKGKIHDLTEITTTASDSLMTLDIDCNFDQQFDEFKSRLLSIIKPEGFAIKYSVPNPVKLQQIATIDLKQSGDDEEEPHYTGLDFLPDGRLVAVDNKNGKCLLYDENLNQKSSFKLPYDYPMDVAVVSEEKVAVTSGGNCKLVILHISETNEITLTKTHKISVSYYSISTKDEENCVVSTLKHDKPFRIVSLSGDESDFDIKLPTKQYAVDKSFCTYIRGKNKVVHCDTDEDTVFIYNTETGEKMTIKDERIKRPRGVAIGPYDHVFVCSEDRRSLVELTPEGRVISSHQLDMTYPRYIAVSKDRQRIAVSNAAAGAKKLSIYKIL